MKEKINKKGFIQIPILIAIIVSITVISAGGYGGFEYHKTSKVIKEAKQLAGEEKYNEAIEKLETAQDSLVVKNWKLVLTLEDIYHNFHIPPSLPIPAYPTTGLTNCLFPKIVYGR